MSWFSAQPLVNILHHKTSTLSVISSKVNKTLVANVRLAVEMRGNVEIVKK